MKKKNTSMPAFWTHAALAGLLGLGCTQCGADEAGQGADVGSATAELKSGKSRKKDKDAIPFENVEKVAMNNAASIWGDVFPSNPIAVYDVDDRLSGYIYNFRRSGPFDEPSPPSDEQVRLENEGPEKEGPDDDIWGKKDFTHLMVNARYSEPPIEQYANALSEEFVWERDLSEMAARALGTKEVELDKVYYLGLSVKWYRYTGEGKAVYVKKLAPPQVLTEDEFEHQVRQETKSQLAEDAAIYEEATGKPPVFNYRREWALSGGPDKAHYPERDVIWIRSGGPRHPVRQMTSIVKRATGVHSG